ncbi:MAG: ribosome silencing factor [Pseudomonadota bacterium]
MIILSVPSERPAAPATIEDVRDLAKSIIDCLQDDKAEDLVVIDLAEKSSIADQMIIASGRSQRHVGALADAVQRHLKEIGAGRARVEGLPNADWVLIDTGDIIVHLFRPEVRAFYNLERIWGAGDPARPVPN